MRVIAIYYLVKNDKQVEKKHLDRFFLLVFYNLFCITICYDDILVYSVNMTPVFFVK